MKFFNVPIKEELHVKFKVLVAKRKSTMEKLLEEAIKDILKKYGEE